MASELEKVDPRELGERLKAARSKAGLSQVEVAQKMDLARTTLVAIEKGQRQIRPEEFRTMCELYDVSANQLLRSSAVHVDLLPRFRSLPKAAGAPASQAARLLNELAAAEVELEALLGHGPRQVSYPPERPILSGDVREQAEDAALELRHRLGLGLSPIVDIVSLLELELGFRVFVRPLDSSVSGVFAFDEALGACVLLNQNHPRERRAQTGAHEIGHFIAARRDPDVFDDHLDVSSSREERFATSFGISFTMPAPLVRRHFHEMQRQAGRFTPRHLILLSHSLHMSEEAVCRRLEDLGLVPGGTWDSLKDRGFSGALVRQVLGYEVEVKQPTMPPRLWLLATEAYRRDLLTEGQLAEMLRMDRLEIREMIDVLDAEGGADGEPLPTS